MTDHYDLELRRLERELQEASDEACGKFSPAPQNIIESHLRSLLARTILALGTKVGRAYELAIPDTDGKITSGGMLKWYNRDGCIMLRYEPAAVDGRCVESREVLMIEGD